MLKLFIQFLIAFLLMSFTICVAEEGSLKALMVPKDKTVSEQALLETEAPEIQEEIPQETPEEISQQVPQNNDSEESVSQEESTQTHGNPQNQQEQSTQVQSEEPIHAEDVQETEENEPPSAAVIEAQLAEEAELREAGVGEEPLVE